MITATVESIDPLTEADIQEKAKQGWRYVEARQYRTRKGSRCWKTTFTQDGSRSEEPRMISRRQLA